MLKYFTDKVESGRFDLGKFSKKCVEDRVWCNISIIL